jgi:predicted transcriptional regulator
MVYVLIAADESYPHIAIEEIAKTMGINKGTIYKYINELMVAGWLTRRIIRIKGRVFDTEYTLKDEKA